MASSSDQKPPSTVCYGRDVRVQLLMRHGTSRLFLVQSCVVIRFAVHSLLFVTFSRQVWNLCEDSRELVTPLSCGAGLPGETSETRQQLHEENSAQADRTDHPKGIWIKPLHEECIVPVQEKRLKKATPRIKLGTCALAFREFDRNLGRIRVRSVRSCFCRIFRRQTNH